MRQPDSENMGNIAASDGLKLFCRQFPVSNERARLLLVHGLGEHCGRYAHVIERLNGKGIAVHTYDHRGHGKSEGRRGHVNRFSEYIDDLSLMIDHTRRDMPENARFILLGHSMGGLIVLNFAENHPEKVDCVIASSPGLAPASKVPFIKGNLGRLMSKVFPALSFDNELVPDHLSHEKGVVDAYVNDPLVHRRITARWFTEFMTAMAETCRDASRIRIPILLQVAGDDRIVHPKTSRDFFEKLASTDKTLCFYDGLFHEIYNETDDHRSRVLADLEKWLGDHI